MADLRDLAGKKESNDQTPVLLLVALLVFVGAFILFNKTAQPAQGIQAPYQPPASQYPEPARPAPAPSYPQQPVPASQPVQPAPLPVPTPQATAYKPDLTFEAIETPKYPITLKKFPVAVKVANLGTGNASAYTVRVQVKTKKDVMFEQEFAFDGLGAKASHSFSFDFAGQFDGDYLVSAFLDEVGRVEESNEGNNAADQLVHLYNKPDLTISYLDVEPNPPAELQDAWITLRVKNVSPIPAQKGAYVRLDLPNSDTKYFVLRIPGVLQQDQEYEFPKMKVRFSGNYAEISAEVDSTKILAEDNEKNNAAAFEVDPSIPDIVVDGVNVSGPSEVTVSVANNSNAALNEDFRVFIKADGLLFGGVDNTSFLVADSFSPGQVIKYKVRNVTPGRVAYHVYVVADPDAFVLESNENNNTREADLAFR